MKTKFLKIKNLQICLLFLIISLSANGQTEQKLYNTPTPSVESNIGINQTGVSEASRQALESANKSYPTGLDNPSQSAKKIESTDVPTFNELYQPPTNDDIDRNPDGTVDMFDKNTVEKQSWEGDKVDMDTYYDRQKDGTYVRKKNNSKSDSQTPIIIIVLAIALGGAVFFIQRNNTSSISSTPNLQTINLGSYTVQEQLAVDNYDQLLDREQTNISAVLISKKSQSSQVIFTFANGEKLSFTVTDAPYIDGNEVKASLISENGQQAYLYKNHNHLSLVNTTTRIKVLMKN
ncbi:hypothetical protein [Chryseobacterium indoltheticum]|uniref:Uncharacterized protein n=1 Tax=Chryseobacterium indoltheticum TaxID=254 RepID=A0A381FKZ1_9FLAO|nr:hypothetical protein [Chryseobacterium indoltheticum]SUX47184.1 Uncharacterised protein [Chryseobacterium indoltheticum]